MRAGQDDAHAQKTNEDKAHQIMMLAGKSRDKVNAEMQKEEARQQWPWLRRRLYALVHSHYFEAVCGLIILFNMGLVVVETDSTVDEGESSFLLEVLTNCLLGIYSTELVAKLYSYRLDFFFEMWNVLDFIIVGMDLVFIFVALIVDELPSLSILRVFRLVRLARAFKAAKSFKELNSLLRACTCALKAIFWGMVMMVMVLTVWGILAVQLIHPINKEIAEKTPQVYEGCDRCPRAFGTVFDSCLTFWKQLVAGDSWGTLCEPIIEHSSWTSIFFMLVLVTVNLTMLNCILAVVVEAGAAAAAADAHDQAKEHEKAVIKAENSLIDLCQGLDRDDSGSLNITEFLCGYREDRNFRECLEVMHVTESDMFMIFNICDEDDSGDVDYREFVEQLRRIKHSGEQMLLHYVTDIRHTVNKIRPECLKPPAKKQQEEEAVEEKLQDSPISPGRGAPSDAEGQLEAAARECSENLPTILEEILGQDPNAEKFRERGNQEGRCDPSTSVSDLIRTERLERMFRINEDLVTIMTDVAQESKVQTGLLNSLVGGFQGSGARSSKEPASVGVDVLSGWYPAGRQVPGEGDVPGKLQQPSATYAEVVSVNAFTRTPNVPPIPGCCVRVV